MRWRVNLHAGIYTNVGGRMSHHIQIYTSSGVRIGYLRITNEAEVLSIYLNDEICSTDGLFYRRHEE